MVYSLKYLLIREVRDRFIQKIIDDWGIKWSNYPLITNDDFTVLIDNKQFDSFLKELIDDIQASLVAKDKPIKILISKENLRRILLNEKGHTRFQNTTKDCLVIYIGYDNWTNFIEEVKPYIYSAYFSLIPYIEVKDSSFFGLITTQRFLQIPIDNEKQEDIAQDGKYTPYKEISKFNYRKVFILACISFFLFSVVSFTYRWYKNRPFSQEQLNNVKFDYVSQYDKPNTSTLKIAYDVSSLNVDTVTVDYGYDEFYLSGTDKIIKNQNYVEYFTKKIDTISHTYFKPNIWAIRLIANGQVIKTLNKIVYSGNDWISWSSGRENGTLWVGKNVSSNITMKNGVLHFDKKDMEKQGGLDYFYTKHQINQDFKISGDSTTLELRVKNRDSEGGFINYDTSISFIDESRSSMLINLVQDCIEYGNIVVAKTNLSGKKRYLPFLDVNLQEWRLVKIKLKDSIATFFIDGKQIFQTRYEGNITSIKGIRVTFKGSGSVDWLKLSNSYNNKVVFFDDFDR